MKAQDTDEVLQRVRELTGLKFDPRQVDVTRRAVQRAMAAAGAASTAGYIAALAADADVLDVLLTELTVGESFFFREPAQLEHIRSVVIPELLARPGRSSVRAWSAGCATGEEAFTLAILLRDAAALGREHVLGTDLSEARLAVARRGRYRRWSLRGVPEDVIARNFHPRGQWFELAPEVLQRVRFRTLNLTGDDAARVSGMDVILCRNVLIYLDRSSVVTVAQHLMNALSDDGWLILGASDPLLDGVVRCETVITEGGVAYRRAAAARALPRKVGRSGGGVRTDVPVELPAAADAASPARLAPRRDVVRPAAVAASAPAPAAARRAAVEKDIDEAAGGEIDAIVAEIWKSADAGELREAALACEDALARFGTRPELLSVKGLVLAAAGHAAEAISVARSAVYLDPGAVLGHVALGTAHAAARNASAAMRDFRNAERLLAGQPSDARVAGSRGDTAAELAALMRLRLSLMSEGDAG